MKKTNTNTYREFDINNDIKEQHQKVMQMTFKKKLSYFLDYYKFHTIVAIFAISLIILLIHDVVTAKDYNFYGIMLNSPDLEGEMLAAEFAEYANLDIENYQCFIDPFTTLSYPVSSEADMAAQQKLYGLIQTTDLDVVTAESHIFYDLAIGNMFIDLREIFTEEELSKYEGNIYYVDNAILEAINSMEANSTDSTDFTAEDIIAESEMHRNPEIMEDPIPMGIYITDSPLVEKAGLYKDSVPIFGFAVQGERIETAKKYLDFIWDESISFETMKTY